MAQINDWREALVFLHSELINEFMHAQVQEAECSRIVDAIETAFSNLRKQLEDE